MTRRLQRVWRDGWLWVAMLALRMAMRQPRRSRKIVAGADVQAGDFVYQAPDGKFYPCRKIQEHGG